MTPTGIQFIDSLHQEWSAGSISRDDALSRLLPWEDDAAIRTRDELEAAWTLRQELEADASAQSHLSQQTPPEQDGKTNGVESAPGAPEAQVHAAANGWDPETERMLADLRANPLITRDDLIAANAICSRLKSGAAFLDGYIRARCAEVDEKVTLYLKDVHSAIEAASHTLQDAPGMDEKLHACDRMRDALADVEALHPDEASLPDMLTWCEETRGELTRLLAERDLVAADVAGILSSSELDTGLVESSKQRLIVLSDMQLSKDDIGLRKTARDLATRLTSYLSSKLQPGATADAEKEAVSEYARVLLLAKQAPEAIGAEQAKSYGELLAAAQAALPPAEQGSEPPERAIPAVPPPQPKSTTITQPITDNLQDGVPYSPATHVLQSNTAPLTPSQPAFHSPMPPPPPPKVQPGWGSTSTQPTQPVYGTAVPHNPVAGVGTGTLTTNPLPPQYNTTVNLAPTQYQQPMPVYGPGMPARGLPPAAWAGIAAGVVAILTLFIVVIVILAGKGGGTNNNGGGGGGGNGGTSASQTARSFYENLQQHNYQGAEDLLAPELAANVGVNDLRGNTVILENQEGPMQQIEVSNATETGSTAQATVKVIYQSNNFTMQVLTLSKNGNKWLITSIAQGQ